mmetsp:Transcript_21195/g.48916  ORF Transcript_21195/g.48916 Transcript_21195/m.48916 type:complete len:110 (+) Transcript_21195:20-349(+)
MIIMNELSLSYTQLHTNPCMHTCLKMGMGALPFRPPRCLHTVRATSLAPDKSTVGRQSLVVVFRRMDRRAYPWWHIPPKSIVMHLQHFQNFQILEFRWNCAVQLVSKQP